MTEQLKVLLIGSGGREHALAWKLSQSPRMGQLICAPGNPGTAQLGDNHSLGDGDVEGLLELARSERIDLTVVGPEAPLAAGIVDRFREESLLIAGPSGRAARLESSKGFAKDFMQRHDIPTAAFQIFAEPEDAEQAVRSGRWPAPLVVKADGLAAGKGVFVCTSPEEALEAIGVVMRERRFGDSGTRVVLEEFLEGEETSFMVFTDGERVRPMVPSQDHKAAYEGDQGPNTGGMGAYSTDQLLDDTLRNKVLDDVIHPTIRGMAAEGAPFEGVLYAGLMLTAAGPKVLEFNVRFGDPETQAILPRLQSDLVTVFEAVARGDLSGIELQWGDDVCVCVVIAAGGYPASYEKGKEITGVAMAEEDPDTIVFHAGTATDGARLVTGGGRVLGVTSLGPTLPAAIMRAYEAVNKIHFDGMYYRRDIAARGLEQM